MEKLKNLLKSDTPIGDEQGTAAGTSTGTSRLAGQGSHFHGKDDYTTGSTVTGTPDTSATSTSRTAAATTAGPEQGGTGHIGTTSASSYTTGQPGTTGSRTGVPDYTASSFGDGSGTAAIDPTTYQKPEAGAHSGTGVGSGAAATAAGLAFARGGERDKSELAGHENPYRASSLDPRVDGLSKSSATTASRTEPTSSSYTSSGLAGTGTGITGASTGSALGSSSGTHHTPHQAAPAPSSLTSTADPVGRSAEYSSSTHSRGLDSATPITSSQPATTSTTTDDNQQGIFGKALTAVGLGGVAGALGAGTVSGRDESAVSDTPHQPTTTTGLESYTAPTQQGPPTSHHRKESIPTTAYPSATFDSVRAINQPVGGAGSPVVHGDRDSYGSHNTSTGLAAGGAAGAAVGAAAVGGHEYQQSKSLRENISGTSHGSAPVLKEANDTTATTGVDSSRYDQAHTLRQNISGHQSTGQTSTGGTHADGLAFTHHATTIGDDTTSQAPSAGTYIPGTFSGTTSGTTSSTTTTPAVARTQETHHTSRDSALGAGAGAAAVGAGAYGSHEYSKKEAEKAEREAEKERHAHEKAVAKEEKHHQKELEKEEKHYNKEHEKEQARLAEIAALKERRQHETEQARIAKLKEEEAEQHHINQQRKSLLGSSTSSEYDGKTEKERKPSILKRIFKRRKNKDTGLDEDYSSDEEQSPVQNKAAVASYGANVRHTALDEGGHSSYPDLTPAEQKAEGSRRASHNPFHKSEHTTETPTTSSTVGHTGTSAAAAAYGTAVVGVGHTALDEKSGAHSTREGTTYASPSTSTATTGNTAGLATGTALGHHTTTTGTHSQSVAPSTLESTGVRSAQSSSAITGVPATGETYHQSHAPTTLGSTGTSSHQGTEAITGLPYDASKDPEAAARLSTHHHGSNPVHNVEGTDGSGINTNFSLGEIGDTRR